MWYTSRSGIIHGSGKESVVPEGLVKNGRTSWTFGRRSREEVRRGKWEQRLSGEVKRMETLITEDLP